MLFALVRKHAASISKVVLLISAIALFCCIVFQAYRYTIAPVHIAKLPKVYSDKTPLRISPSEKDNIYSQDQDKKVYRDLLENTKSTKKKIPPRAPETSSSVKTSAKSGKSKAPNAVKVKDDKKVTPAKKPTPAKKVAPARKNAPVKKVAPVKRVAPVKGDASVKGGASVDKMLSVRKPESNSRDIREAMRDTQKSKNGSDDSNSRNLRNSIRLSKEPIDSPFAILDRHADD